MANSLKIISPEVKQEVNQIFAAYLESSGFRKTPERAAILEEIYSRNDHFDAESLYIEMKADRYRVSRATVYNTLELLVNCDLVQKHQFGKNITLYEKSYGFKQHDHVICTNCGKIVEFCDPRIHQIKQLMSEMLQFKITHHALNLYGICSSCEINGTTVVTKSKPDYVTSDLLLGD